MTTAAPDILDVPFEYAPDRVRHMRVRVPDEGQLAVWAATAERFSSLGDEWRAQAEALAGRDEDDPDMVAFRQQRAEQGTRALSRALKIINSALADQHDRDWVEDQLLEHAMTLGSALGIITAAVEVLQTRKRVQAPTNGPAAKKKATRV